MFEQLASKFRDNLHCIDSTIVIAHRAASGAKRGRRGKGSVSDAVAVRRISTRQLTEKA